MKERPKREGKKVDCARTCTCTVGRVSCGRFSSSSSTSSSYIFALASYHPQPPPQYPQSHPLSLHISVLPYDVFCFGFNYFLPRRKAQRVAVVVRDRGLDGNEGAYYPDFWYFATIHLLTVL